MNILGNFLKDFRQLVKDMTTTKNPRPPEIYMEERLSASWGGIGITEDKIKIKMVKVGDVMPIKVVNEETSGTVQELRHRPGQDEFNKREIERGNAVIKSLRNRSEKKAESNRQLNMKIEEYKYMRKMDQAELRRLAGEVENGNEYREGQKCTILELHETIKKEKDRRMKAEKDAARIENDLRRSNGIIDLLLQSHGITGPRNNGF